MNRADQDGVSAVYRASKFDGDILSLLLERGGQPDLIAPCGYTALCGAFEEGFIKNMKLLLRSGANIEHQGPHGWTPLLLAINAGQNDGVQLLLDYRADISAILDDSAGALYLAVNNNITVLGSLLAKDNDANSKHRANRS